MPPVKCLDRPREIDLRAIVDAILYLVRTGCQWRPSAVHHGAGVFLRSAGPQVVRADQF
ncbi:MAG: transposase [Acidobacteriaceae bacterium]|nr:transposase [Acidobacteriaceae bacterium]